MENDFDNVVVNSTLSKKQYRSVMYFSMYKKNKWFTIFILTISLIAIFEVFGYLSKLYYISYGSFRNSILFFILIGLTFLMVEFAVIKYSKSNRIHFNKVQKTTFCDEGVEITMESPKMYAMYNWDIIHCAYHIKDFFLLYITSNQCIILDKTNIDLDSQLKISEILKSKLNKKYHNRYK